MIADVVQSGYKITPRAALAVYSPPDVMARVSILILQGFVLLFPSRSAISIMLYLLMEVLDRHHRAGIVSCRWVLAVGSVVV